MHLRRGVPIFLAHRNLPPQHPKERDAKDGIVPQQVNTDTRESLMKTWVGQVENWCHGHGHHNADGCDMLL